MRTKKHFTYIYFTLLYIFSISQRMAALFINEEGNKQITPPSRVANLATFPVDLAFFKRQMWKKF